nr:GNAT family N-acetyltransferase [Bradyrhizobium elkanii]
MEAFHAQAAAEQAGYFGLISVSEPAILELMAQCGLPPRYTNDRFIMDVGHFGGFEDYVATLHPDIRRELRRQQRLFAASGATIAVETPPFDDLDEVVALCRRTAARYAGEFYYPALPTRRLLERLGPGLRLVSVRVGSVRIGVLVCFFEPPRFHIWAAGMRYDLARFSPYAMSMSEAIRYAIASGMIRVEGGRGNARIKLKQGFSPLKLYACIRATS